MPSIVGYIFHQCLSLGFGVYRCGGDSQSLQLQPALLPFMATASQLCCGRGRGRAAARGRGMLGPAAVSAQLTRSCRAPDPAALAEADLMFLVQASMINVPQTEQISAALTD